MTRLTLHLHQQTHRDLLVSLDGDAERSVWLRLQHIRWQPAGEGRVVVDCPEWLAKERGLI